MVVPVHPEPVRLPETGFNKQGIARDEARLKNGVTIEGGYAGCGAPDPDVRDTGTSESILSGDLASDDGPDFADNDENSYHVVSGSGTEASAILDGFTITGGNANGPSPHDHGAGVYSAGGAPSIRNCTITRNRAQNGDASVPTQERGHNRRRLRWLRRT